MTPVAIAALVAAFAVSFIGTMLVRRYAMARLLDVPNDRSMHTTPTPRGGGLAIAAACFAFFIVGGVAGWLEPRTVFALLVGGLAVAVIGWVDDHGGVSARARMAVHLAASAFAVYMLGGFDSVSLGSAQVTLGAAGWVLAVVGITWAINFFNFMDGIDGIAGVEATTAALFGGMLLLAAGQPGLAWAAFVIAAAALGFLPWNWSPARIFMGDVGSGLLGFLFGVLAVASENAGGSAALWGLLLGVFVVDATITFVRRLLRGERVYVAHRKHAYQRLVRSGHSHRRVSLWVLGLNLALGLLALLATWKPGMSAAWIGIGLLGLGLCYLAVERVLRFDG